MRNYPSVSRQRGWWPLDNSDSSQQHFWHGLTLKLLKINTKMKKNPYSRECISPYSSAVFLSDSLRIKHFDLQKLSLITLNYWGYTFPLHSSSDSYLQTQLQSTQGEGSIFVVWNTGVSTFWKEFFIPSKTYLLLNKPFMTGAITSKFKLSVVVMAGETSKIFSTTYPMRGLQITFGKIIGFRQRCTEVETDKDRHHAEMVQDISTAIDCCKQIIIRNTRNSSH